jgi:ribosomal protein S18 acetylase RimI-like enzyme
MMSILAESDDLTYAILDAKDLTQVADTVAQGFTDGSEPTALALGLAPEDFKPLVEALLPKFLRDGLSIVARDTKTGEIAGVQLNEEMEFDLPVELTGFEWTAPVFALAGEMYSRYFQGELLEPHESVHIFMIVVSNSLRGKSVGQKLLDLSLEHARARGFRRAVVEATGLISQHIMRKAGFANRVEILYATFEYQGKRPFENTGDHPSIVLMDKDL